MRRVDPFLLAILASAVVASLLPVRGWGVGVFDGGVKVAVFGLFFLYGARLSTREALAGLTHWRLHLTILGLTYAAFPLIGLALRWVAPGWLPTELVVGLVYLTLVPSTVQSSVTFTSIAGGNVPGAIVSASASNLLGVVFTPLLVAGLLGTGGQVSIGAGAVLDLVVLLLVPFVLGQLARRWLGGAVTRHRDRLKYIDQLVIVLVVYSAFSAGMRERIWERLTWGSLGIVLAVCLVLLVVMLCVTWWLAARLGFGRADRIAIQFCGTKKSLATGLPMAAVLFGSGLGAIIIPLMVFHQAQLMACSWLAGRYARAAT